MPSEPTETDAMPSRGARLQYNRAMSEPRDLIVIGSGPGGYVAAIRAAQLGMKVAVVEKDDRYGGTCLLRGCIPTKALLHTADLLDQVRQAERFGVQAGEASVDIGKAQEYKRGVVDKNAKGVQFLFKKNQVTLPVKLRDALKRDSKKRTLYLFPIDPRCLYVYTERRLKETLQHLRETMYARGTEADFRRGLFSRITEIEPDPQGRFVLPEPVRKAAGIQQTVVWLGNDDRIELWSKERWDEVQATVEPTFEEKMQHILHELEQ